MDIILTCCHCNNIFIVNTKEFNCKILRHGIYKSNYQQINPHLPKNECDRLFNNDLIYGCGKPLQIIVNDNNDYEVIICDYI